MWHVLFNLAPTFSHFLKISFNNVITNAESRTMIDRSDWQLNLEIFSMIVQRFSPIEVDVFASQLITQCPAYFSWRPDPYAVATDAFM